MPRDTSIPWCDICEKAEATSVENGIYRCEPCESAHEATPDPADEVDMTVINSFDEEPDWPVVA